MASPDRSKRKILKAKKTMPTSCRKQREILNKSRNVEALKTTAIGNNAPSSNQNLNTMVINNKSRYSENVDSSLNADKNLIFSQKNRIFAQNLLNPVKEIVDSKTRLKNVNEQVTLGSPRKLFIQEAEDSQKNSSETHLDYQANVAGPFLKHEENCNMKSIYYSPIIDHGIVQHTLNDKRIDKVVSSLEANSNSESHNERQKDILSSDSHFLPVEKASDLVNAVGFSNYTVNLLKSEKPSRTYHPIILNCENTNSKQQSLFDTDSNNGHNQKKRMFLENKENVKRMKTSEQINGNICVALEKQTAALEQVKDLIRQEICSINYKLFDQKLKDLNERIGKMQCRNNHEATAGELFAKIARLQRRIRTILSQGNCLEPNTLSRNTASKTINSEIIHLYKNQESVNGPNERMTSVNCDPSNLSEKESEKINLSPDCVEFVSESNIDDVMLISVENPNSSTPVTSNPKDIRKTTRNFKNSHNKAKAIMKKPDFVIDLTKDGLFKNINTESLAPSVESLSKAVLNSKEITPVAENAAKECDSFEYLPPLPEPPPPLPELADKILDTLPPQKTELKVKRVLSPMGIALSWNITKINPKCAPVESYHLFLCHESSDNELIWKKVGEIKALPLPMACTISQSLISNKYYFTVQSKDIFGRYGPFCDIKSIPGFSENLT